MDSLNNNVQNSVSNLSLYNKIEVLQSQSNNN